MNFSSLCAKGLGALTAGLVLYDAHKNGTINGTMNAKRNVANTVVDQYVQSNHIGKMSTVEVNAKKAWFNMIMDNNIKEFFDATGGYISGFVSSIVTDIIPAALATGALAFKNRGGKLCSLGLLIYGAKYFLHDIMNVGKRDYLKENI